MSTPESGDVFQAWCSHPGCWHSKEAKMVKTSHRHAAGHYQATGHRVNVWCNTYEGHELKTAVRV